MMQLNRYICLFFSLMLCSSHSMVFASQLPINQIDNYILAWDISPKKYSNAVKKHSEENEKPGDIVINDRVYDVTVDQAGNIYATGSATISKISQDGIAQAVDNSVVWQKEPISTYTNSDQQGSNLTADITVMKFNPQGELLWHTFLGGVGEDWGKSIALDYDGNVVVAGFSRAAWGNPLSAFNVGSNLWEEDITILKLNASGHLLWHSFLGGEGYDLAESVAVDRFNNIVIAGSSYANWGTSAISSYTPGYNAIGAFTADINVMKLKPSGELLWHTFLGGAGDDHANALVLNEQGDIYVTGKSNTAWGEPLRGFTQGNNQWNTLDDISVLKLNSQGQLLWHSFLGGIDDDEANSIAIDQSGNIYIAGFSNASWGDNPLKAFTASFDSNGWSAGDMLVSKIDANGHIIWHSFIGGLGHEYCTDIEVDEMANIFLSAVSNNSWGNNPTSAFTAGFDHYDRASQDITAVKLNPQGDVVWNTFIGDENTQYVYGSKVDKNGNIFLSGDKGNYSATLFKLSPTSNSPTIADSEFLTVSGHVMSASIINSKISASGDSYHYPMAVLTQPEAKTQVKIGQINTVDVEADTLLVLNPIFMDTNQVSENISLIRGQVTVKRKCSYSDFFRIKTAVASISISPSCERENLNTSVNISYQQNEQQGILSVSVFSASLTITDRKGNVTVVNSGEEKIVKDRVTRSSWVLPIPYDNIYGYSNNQFIWTAYPGASAYLLEYNRLQPAFTKANSKEVEFEKQTILITENNSVRYQDLIMFNINIKNEAINTKFEGRIFALDEFGHVVDGSESSDTIQVLWQ